jgi:hypothetical protein
MTHAERVVDLATRFDDAMARFGARVNGAAAEAAERTPPGGGWSVAQMAWHVGVISDAFAGLIDGSIAKARPAPPGYTEAAWSSLASKVPQQFEAPARFRPPATVKQADTALKLRVSGEHMKAALAGLTADRATWTVESILGPITLYQVGEWAIAHVIRHNAQAKRTLEQVTASN